MFKKLFGGSGSAAKYAFDLRILQVSGLPASIKRARVVMVRNSKYADSDPVEVRGGMALLDHTITWVGTMQRQRDGYAPKEYVFKIQAPGDGRDDWVTIGKGEVDMAQFVKEGTKVGPKQKSLDVPIKVGAEQGLASLKLSVSSHPKGPGDDGLTEVTGTAVTGSMGPRSDQDLSGFDAKTPPPSKGNDKKGGSKSRLPTTPEDEELKDTADTEQLLGRPGAGAAVVQSDVPNWGARKPPRVPARHESDDDDVSPMNSDLEDDAPEPASRPPEHATPTHSTPVAAASLAAAQPATGTAAVTATTQKLVRPPPPAPPRPAPPPPAPAAATSHAAAAAPSAGVGQAAVGQALAAGSADSHRSALAAMPAPAAPIMAATAAGAVTGTAAVFAANNQQHTRDIKAEAELSRLQAEMGQLQLQLQALQQENTSLRQSSEAQAANMQQQEAQLAARTTALDQREAQLSSEAAAAHRRAAELDQKVLQQDAELAALRAELEGLAASQLKLQIENDELKGQLVQLHEADDIIKEWEVYSQGLEKDNAALQAKVSELEAVPGSLKAMGGADKEQLEQLQRELAEARRQAAAAGKQSEAAEKQVLELQAQLGQLTEEKGALERQLALLSAQAAGLAALEQELSQQQQQRAALEEELSQQQQQQEALADELEALQQQLDDEREQGREREEALLQELQQVQGQAALVEMLQAEVAARMEQRVALEGEVSSLQQQLEGLRGLQEQATVLAKDKEAAAWQLQLLEQDKAELEERVQGLGQEKEALERRLQEAVQQQAALQLKLEEAGAEEQQLQVLAREKAEVEERLRVEMEHAAALEAHVSELQAWAEERAALDAAEGGGAFSSEERTALEQQVEALRQEAAGRVALEQQLEGVRVAAEAEKARYEAQVQGLVVGKAELEQRVEELQLVLEEKQQEVVALEESIRVQEGEQAELQARLKQLQQQQQQQQLAHEQQLQLHVEQEMALEEQITQLQEQVASLQAAASVVASSARAAPGVAAGSGVAAGVALRSAVGRAQGEEGSGELEEQVGRLQRQLEDKERSDAALGMLQQQLLQENEQLEEQVEALRRQVAELQQQQQQPAGASEPASSFGPAGASGATPAAAMLMASTAVAAVPSGNPFDEHPAALSPAAHASSNAAQELGDVDYLATRALSFGSDAAGSGVGSVREDHISYLAAAPLTLAQQLQQQQLLQQQQQQLAALQEQCAGLTKQYDEVSQQLEAVQQQYGELKARYEEAAEQLEEARQEREDMVDEHQGLQEEYEELQSMYEALVEKHRRLSSQGAAAGAAQGQGQGRGKGRRDSGNSDASNSSVSSAPGSSHGQAHGSESGGEGEVAAVTPLLRGNRSARLVPGPHSDEDTSPWTAGSEPGVVYGQPHDRHAALYHAGHAGAGGEAAAPGALQGNPLFMNSTPEASPEPSNSGRWLEEAHAGGEHAAQSGVASARPGQHDWYGSRSGRDGVVGEQVGAAGGAWHQGSVRVRAGRDVSDDDDDSSVDARSSSGSSSRAGGSSVAGEDALRHLPADGPLATTAAAAAASSALGSHRGGAQTGAWGYQAEESGRAAADVQQREETLIARIAALEATLGLVGGDDEGHAGTAWHGAGGGDAERVRRLAEDNVALRCELQELRAKLMRVPLLAAEGPSEEDDGSSSAWSAPGGAARRAAPGEPGQDLASLMMGGLASVDEGHTGSEDSTPRSSSSGVGGSSSAGWHDGPGPADVPLAAGPAGDRVAASSSAGGAAERAWSNSGTSGQGRRVPTQGESTFRDEWMGGGGAGGASGLAAPSGSAGEDDMLPWESSAPAAAGGTAAAAAGVASRASETRLATLQQQLEAASEARAVAEQEAAALQQRLTLLGEWRAGAESTLVTLQAELQSLRLDLSEAKQKAEQQAQRASKAEEALAAASAAAGAAGAAPYGGLGQASRSVSMARSASVRTGVPPPTTAGSGPGGTAQYTPAPLPSGPGIAVTEWEGGLRTGPQQGWPEEWVADGEEASTASAVVFVVRKALSSCHSLVVADEHAEGERESGPVGPAAVSEDVPLRDALMLVKDEAVALFRELQRQTRLAPRFESQVLAATQRIEELETALAQLRKEYERALYPNMRGGRGKKASPVSALAPTALTPLPGSSAQSDSYGFGYDVGGLEVSALAQQLELEQREREEGEAQLRELELRNAELEQELQALKGPGGDKGRLRGRGRRGEDSELAAKVEKLEGMLEDLELQLEGTTQAYETAESRLQQCQAQLEKAQEQLRVQRTSAMGTDAAEELQDLEEQVAGLSLEVQELRRQLASERQARQQAEQQLQELEEEHEESGGRGGAAAAAELEALKAKNAKLKERYKLLEESCTEEIDALNEQLDAAQQRVSELEQMMARPTRTRSVESELVQLRADNERLVLQLVEKQVEIARLSEEETMLKRELTRARTMSTRR